MADISKKELLVPLGTYHDMIKRRNAYEKKEGKKPSKIFLVNKGKDWVTYAKLADMEKRVNAWKKKNPKKVLNNVWIVKPKNTTNVLDSRPNTNTELPKLNIKGKQYQPKNFTAFYNLMGGFGYSYYYNDVYTLAQEIKNLTIGKAMNCSDLSQTAVFVASEFKKDGKKVYTTRYVHINCKSGGGHVAIDIKGGEFGNKWTRIDLAAKADKNSRVYPIGDYWCKDGKVRGYDELWAVIDDGK